jgi:hypothetical protein
VSRATHFYDWTPRAVVFDCDGLLMDTEPCCSLLDPSLVDWVRNWHG